MNPDSGAPARCDDAAVEWHVCSLLVTAKPAWLASVSESIGALEGGEIAATNPIGKLVVTLETDTEAAIVQAMGQIESIDGVVNTALVYHYAEPFGEESPAAKQP